MGSLGRHLRGGFSTAALLRAGAGASVATSLMLGAEITAAADPDRALVQLDLYWPDVRFASVTRVDAAGVESPVRNCDPLLLNTRAVMFDHEAPLDADVTYRIYEYGGTVYWESDSVTVSSDGACGWLKHIYRPYLNRTVGLTVMGRRELGARRGIARPIDRTDPIVVYQNRLTDSGVVIIRTDDWDELAAIREILADGAPLLLQQPAELGGESLFISVDTTSVDLLDPTLGLDLSRDVTLPFDVLDWPPGAMGGPVGCTYDDVAVEYLTYEHVAAGEPTYADLATEPGF